MMNKWMCKKMFLAILIVGTGLSSSAEAMIRNPAVHAESNTLSENPSSTCAVLATTPPESAVINTSTDMDLDALPSNIPTVSTADTSTGKRKRIKEGSEETRNNNFIFPETTAATSSIRITQTIIEGSVPSQTLIGQEAEKLAFYPKDFSLFDRLPGESLYQYRRRFPQCFLQGLLDNLGTADFWSFLKAVPPLKLRSTRELEWRSSASITLNQLMSLDSDRILNNEEYLHFYENGLKLYASLNSDRQQQEFHQTQKMLRKKENQKPFKAYIGLISKIRLADAGSTKLDFSDNSLTLLPPASTWSHLTGLKELSLSNNKLESLSGIVDRTSLECLYVSDNQITSANDLTALTALQELRLDDNPITSVAGLELLTALEELRLDDHKLLQILPGEYLLVSQERIEANRNAMNQFISRGLIHPEGY